MDKRALIVGINTYDYMPDLDACINDARAISELLEKNADETPNYECTVLLDRTEDNEPITRAALREACQELFADFRGNVLLYFSGHGLLTQFGGHLCAFDSQRNDWGVPMEEILKMATASQANDVLIILDCCYSGDMGNPPLLNINARLNDSLALLRENVTIIAASRASQVSVEAGGHGLFTAALLDALAGGAADHMGWITAPAIYSYVQRRFGSRDQRPVYKSHTTEVTVIRECAPLIDRLKLRKLIELFPTLDYQFPLDPEYEPEDEHGNLHEPVNEVKRAIALLFKDYRDAGLLKPSIPGEQFFWTARWSHTVELTARGREYWWLVKYKKFR